MIDNYYDIVSTKGAELMDEYDPEWYTYVDEDDIDMSDPDACILGQCCGGYRRGIYIFDLSTADAEDYGFDVFNGSFRRLKAAWLRRIHERQVAPAD